MPFDVIYVNLETQCVILYGLKLRAVHMLLVFIKFIIVIMFLLVVTI